MKRIICQAIDCEKQAMWRVVDHYTQQKQTYTYTFFYYYCDDCCAKEQERPLTVGHNKEFFPLIDAVMGDICNVTGKKQVQTDVNT